MPVGPAGQPPPADLTARVFRALYQEFDLHFADGTHIAVPKGVPCFAAPTLSEIARQISSSQHSDSAAPAPGILPGRRVPGSPGPRS
jgi:hypothetical protein